VSDSLLTQGEALPAEIATKLDAPLPPLKRYQVEKILVGGGSV
jgi:hypothetical protein